MPYSRTTWVDYPSTSTPINAARLNNIETGILAVEAQAGAIYATEAARDAAITSPTEGMRSYITASTVAAATGATTMVPTGIQTVYNGTAWVCVTEVGAASTTLGNSFSTSYVTTLTGDTTPISVTLNTGTTALLSFGASYTPGGGAEVIRISVSVSGATTASAIDAYSVYSGSQSYQNSPFHTVIYTGLTSGANTFTLNYKCQSGFTNTYYRRSLIAKGIA